MAKRITAEEAAMLGLEGLLGVFDLLQQPPPHYNKLMAQQVALGVDHLQDALWKSGVDCRCASPPGAPFGLRRGLDWLCTCEPRGQSTKRRKRMKAISEHLERKTG